MKKRGIEDQDIHIFIVAEDEADYRAIFADTQVMFHMGRRGLVEQRQFILETFPGEDLVFMDDDISNFLSLETFNLELIIKAAFRECRKYKLRLWGIYPVANRFFMDKTVTTDLKYIVGCFYGLINVNPLNEFSMDDKEDFYRTCNYYQYDAGVMRMNWIAPVTKYYKEKGGMAERRTLATNQQGTELVAALFPDYATITKRKNNPYVNLRLRDRTKNRSSGSPSTGLGI